ncbi:hypothetical protein Tco_1436343 [Tanacetum coccineum]
MESMKTAYLADQRGRGDGNDPFLEADRREIAKQAAAAKRVHPTLHLPSNSQPSTQAGGLLTSSTTPAASAAAPASASAPAAGVSGSAPGLFSSPFTGASSSLFSTPATTAPSFSMFSSSSASPQTSLFSGLSSTTPSLFNTTLAATSTSFATNPTTGASSFSTPFGTETLMRCCFQAVAIAPAHGGIMRASSAMGQQQRQEASLHQAASFVILGP